MNSPNHNPAINNVNCKALGGQEQLLGDVWVYNHNHFGDKYHGECLHSAGGQAPRLLEFARDIRQMQTCKEERWCKQRGAGQNLMGMGS